MVTRRQYSNAPWQNRIVGHGDEKPDQLLANPRNWRIHPQAQQDALASLLDTVGWVQDVIVNQRTGHVVDGHLRVSLAISRNEPAIPVVYVDLEPEEEALVLASLDPLAAMAATDKDMLADLLQDVSAEGALASMLEELSGGKAPIAGLTDPDEVPEVEVPVSKRGDLWLLGEHRLLCGDSTDAGDVAKLLDGATPRIMVTDPPYGVEYDPMFRERALGAADRRTGAVTNDDNVSWATAWELAPVDVAYVWHADRFAIETGVDLLASGFEIRATIIWRKPHLPWGQGHYSFQHEPCWYAVRKGATAHWQGDRSQSTVWDISLSEDHGGHSTQKPVECMERPLRNHDAPEVYEPFSGSGTTIIASERLGRRCYAMEIEPRYVDVAVRRWEQYTGRKAVRDGAPIEANA